ncbi:thioesterase II family protein [Pendulispora albinea]|uniref:Thioesterase domain-containing protein n=1 Tax=Pendulispora albinea TaxID=2741071 RepID=A0ABZ2LYE3_9BACT
MSTSSEQPASSRRSIVTFGSLGSPVMRLFCFPFAGGSSVSFKNWSESIPRTAISAIELPGRGRLFGVPPLRRLSQVVDYAVDAIDVRIDMPFALYGHNMGAVAALEAARALARRGKRASCLIVSGSAAPHVPSRRRCPMYLLSRNELVDALQQLDTLPDGLVSKPDILDAFLPTIRADLEALETWEGDITDIRVPIHAIGGKDDPHVSWGDLLEWGRYTSTYFNIRQVAGGHSFIKSHEDYFLALLRECLTQRPIPTPESGPTRRYVRGSGMRP